MKLKEIPFDGLFVVYEYYGKNMVKAFAAVSPDQIPPEYRNRLVTRLYPFHDSIIVEIS